MRRYILGVLLILLFAGLLGINPAHAFDTSNRITELKYSTGASAGKPNIDGDLIIWTEQVGLKNYPCYLDISQGNKYILDNATNNGEWIEASDGVLVYRSYGDYYLTVTNISGEVKLGIEPGESTVIPDLSVTGFYQVSEEGVVFLVRRGKDKDFYYFFDKDLPLKHLFTNQAQNLHLSNHNGRILILWFFEEDLFYCYLDKLDDINKLKTNNKVRSDYICTYGNQVVYFDNNRDLYIQEIATNSEPRKVPVDAHYMYLHLVNDRIYYLDKEKHICFYDLNTLENKSILKLNDFPLSLASNGSDIVWKDYNYKLYWYAGLVDMKLDGAIDVVEKGSNFQLNAIALYSNNQEEDISKYAKWYSSNNEVITVENGLCQAITAGASIITVEYEGMSLSTPIVVREVLGLEIISAKSELEVGDIEQFEVYLVYSDDSRVDVTNEVIWLSELNEIVDGLYRADNCGIDKIRVFYAGLEASFIIRINDLDYNEPEDPKPIPEPEPEPEPVESDPDYKKGQSRSQSKQISYNSIDDNKLKEHIEKIITGEGWYFDILRFCYRLFLPYPLIWEI